MNHWTRIRGLLLSCAMLLSAYGCSSGQNCSLSQDDEPVLHVLFIGNSYTYVNDLPGMFSELACAGGHQVETGMAAEGGWTLADHVASVDTFQKLKAQQWDYVVLQEQSQIPAVENYRDQVMYPAVRTLVSKIKELGEQPYLFLTWGHRDGFPETNLQNYNDMQYQLSVGYGTIARELGVQVVPVGNAWYQAVTQDNPIDLWQSDGSHPNEEGTYLAACVFYAQIFQESPVGLSYRAGISQDIAKGLQTLAANAVLNH